MSLATDQQHRAWAKAKAMGLTSGKRSDAGRKPVAVLPPAADRLRPQGGTGGTGGAAMQS